MIYTLCVIANTAKMTADGFASTKKVYFTNKLMAMALNKPQMRARRGVLALTAGSDLLGRRNVGKVKRTMYCDVYKAYFFSKAKFFAASGCPCSAAKVNQ